MVTGTSFAALSFLCACQIVYAANKSVTFDRIVGNGTAIEYIKLNSNFPDSPQVPGWMCKTNGTKYRGYIEETLAKGYPDIFRVPHSRIFEDGVRCGDKNDSYPLEYLYIENHMRLFPYRFMTNMQLAKDAGIIVPFRLLSDGYANNTRHIASQLLQEAAQNDLWMGFEENARICGGKTILPAQSFLLFARSRSNTRIRAQFAGLLNPNTGVRVPETSYTFEGDEDIQIAFYEPFGDPSEVVDLVCPSRNALFKKTEATPPPNGTSTPSDKNDSDDSPACFPGSATVYVEGRGQVNMDKLKLGDRVLGGDGQFTNVFMFTHKLQDIKKNFVTLSTLSGKTLSLTKGHYITVNGAFVAAEEVQVGSTVTLADGTIDSVERISSATLRGLYNPQTIRGDIVVDGILCSTYTTAIEPNLAHAILAPFRAMFSSYGMTSTAFESGAGQMTPLLR